MMAAPASKREVLEWSMSQQSRAAANVRPKDHFEKRFEGTCTNHTYPVKHKISDYDMMKSFMTSRSLS
jgi:hypothetical protein